MLFDRSQLMSFFVKPLSGATCVVVTCGTFYLFTFLFLHILAQWVVRPTHTRLVPGSKHDWCENPLVFAMIAR